MFLTILCYTHVVYMYMYMYVVGIFEVFNFRGLMIFTVTWVSLSLTRAIVSITVVFISKRYHITRGSCIALYQPCNEKHDFA